MKSEEKERGEMGEEDPAENKSWFFDGGWSWVERQLKGVLACLTYKIVTIASTWGGDNEFWDYQCLWVAIAKNRTARRRIARLEWNSRLRQGLILDVTPRVNFKKVLSPYKISTIRPGDHKLKKKNWKPTPNSRRQKGDSSVLRAWISGAACECYS